MQVTDFATNLYCFVPRKSGPTYVRIDVRYEIISLLKNYCPKVSDVGIIMPLKEIVRRYFVLYASMCMSLVEAI